MDQNELPSTGRIARLARPRSPAPPKCLQPATITIFIAYATKWVLDRTASSTQTGFSGGAKNA
jgi:hypothetical protein